MNGWALARDVLILSSLRGNGCAEMPAVSSRIDLFSGEALQLVDEVLFAALVSSGRSG